MITQYGVKHHLMLYDERAAGKDADALCSLRFHHYMKPYFEQRDLKLLALRPKYLFLILDNCVGQNKSQFVLMLFQLLVCIGVFDRVVLHFLVSGHSHGTPDIGYAHAKRPLKDNYFLPEDIAKKMNSVEGINAGIVNFGDFESEDYVFRSGWGVFFKKHFKEIPALEGNPTI